MRRRHPPARLLAVPVCLACAFARAEDAPTVLALQSVVVVGTTILPGQGVPLDEVPSNVQTLQGAALKSPRASTLAQALDQGVGSVNVNDTAGNAFQLDVNFRGFTASPALGTPQGLSVFVDGVRVNEVFGDTVNWDLIPEGAIASIAVVPGSNPVFGLNTLGGALSVTTRDGFDESGGEVRAWGGQWGRKAADFEGGVHDAHLAAFVAGSVLHEEGWGDHDPSRVGQLFTKAGWRDDRDRAELSLSLADTRLEGNQTLPLTWLSDYRTAYSWPDFQSNRLVFINANASHRLDAGLLVEVNAFHRQLKTFVLNSNVNGDFDPTRAVGQGNQPTGNVINDVAQSRSGASMQVTSTAAVAGHPNHLSAGASFESGFTAFTQSSQEAGSSRDTTSDKPVSLDTSLHARASAAGMFATDTLGLGAKTFLNVAGRYNAAHVDLSDQLGTALNGRHVFRRFDPSVGLTANPSDVVTLYGAYNEGMRVPTPVELSCADPNAPCSLPNAFSSDPDLKPVISHNVELGARGKAMEGLRWSVAVFRTELHDDIQFISSGGGATSAGYFRNVGNTRRQGAEFGLDAVAGAFTLGVHYSLVDATFRTPMVLNSPDNSTAAPISCPECSDIRVRPGNHLPSVPRHTFKLRADYALGEAASFGATLVAQGSQYARGDENNADVNGKSPGFALVDVDGRMRLGAGWEAFANVSNLFNRRTSRFATLGENVFTGPGRSFDATGASWRAEQFRTAGAPRGIRAGLTWHFDAPSAS